MKYVDMTLEQAKEFINVNSFDCGDCVFAKVEKAGKVGILTWYRDRMQPCGHGCINTAFSAGLVIARAEAEYKRERPHMLIESIRFDHYLRHGCTLAEAAEAVRKEFTEDE